MALLGPEMSAKALGLLVGAVTLVVASVASVAPASAEFFGCNEPRSKVSYLSGYRSHHAQAQSSPTSAPRQRYTSQPSQRRYASQSRSSQWH